MKIREDGFTIYISLLFHRYRLITAILTEAGIDAIPVTWHIEQLTTAIEDVTKGDEPKGKFKFKREIHIYFQSFYLLCIDFFYLSKHCIEHISISLQYLQNLFSGK